MLTGRDDAAAPARRLPASENFVADDFFDIRELGAGFLYSGDPEFQISDSSSSNTESPEAIGPSLERNR
ncbi:hypothetical protein LguiA_012248 [Lonicera macranthoides]